MSFVSQILFSASNDFISIKILTQNNIKIIHFYSIHIAIPVEESSTGMGCGLLYLNDIPIGGNIDSCLCMRCAYVEQFPVAVRGIT